MNDGTTPVESVASAAPTDGQPEQSAGHAWAVGAIALALLVWIGFRWATGIELEDALITYRYAENLAEGRGFVFNVGERVLGTTTPLYTLLLAAGGMLFGVGNIPLLSNIFGLLAGAGAGWAAYRLCRAFEVGPGWSALTVLLLCVHPKMLWTTTGGMETPLVLCLMMMSLLATVRRSWTTALIVVALLVLTRPDGLIWAGLITLVVIWHAGRRALGPLLVAALLVGAWVGFAFFYFGSPIPHSVTAKRALELTYTAAQTEAYTLHGYLHWYLAQMWLPHTYGFAKHQVWGWLVLMGLGVLGIARRPDRARPLMLLPLFVVAFCAAFYLGRSPRFPWYSAPLTWCAVMLGMLGLYELWIVFSLYWREFKLPNGVLGAARLAALGALAMTIVNRGLVTYRYERDNQLNETELRRGLGLWLKENTDPQAVIATEAIGYQGYYSDRKLLDLAGLICPEVVALLRETQSPGATFNRIVRELAPEYIVLRSFEVADNTHFHGGPLLPEPDDVRYFHQHYAPAVERVAPRPEAPNWRVRVGDEWKSQAEVTVYRRTGPRSAPPAEAGESGAAVGP
jgi:hypothetical protein